MYCLVMVIAVMVCLIEGQVGSIMLPMLRPEVLFLTGHGLASLDSTGLTQDLALQATRS